MEARIVYFEKPGKENTYAVLEIAKRRAGELGIKTFVIASNHGYTADRAVRVLEGNKIIIVASYYSPTLDSISNTLAEGDEKLVRSRATVIIATHLFAGVSSAMRKKYNSVETSEIVASTLRMVSTGTKVAVECSIMAADAGLVKTDEDVIAVGGTKSGSDTAIVLRPVNSQDLFDVKIKEILCKPREW